MLAGAVAAYRDGVAARLRQADAERSAALAREAEQRKRRKLVQWAAGLLAAVLTLGIVGTTMGMVRADNAATAEAEQKRLALAAADSEKAANEHTRHTQKILLEIFADLELRKVKAATVPLEQVLASRLMKAGDQLDAQAAGNPLEIAELQNQLSVSLLGLGFTKEALVLAAKSLGTRTAQLGTDHRATLASMNSVAVCHYLEGRFDVAEPMYEDILRQRKQRLGPDHPETLLSMSNLADCYRAGGKLTLALPLIEETLQRRKQVLGLDHADTLTSMSNLAAVYLTVGDAKRALPLFEETLKQQAALLGPNHVDTLTSMGNLARCYTVLDQLDRALPLLEEVMKLMKTRLGRDHPSTLISMCNLGLGYHAARQYDRALPILEETLRLSRDKLGVDHPDTLLNMSNLASCYQAANQMDRAIPLYEETLKRQKAKLGDDHPSTLIAMNNLASGYQKLRQFDRAVPLLEEALQRMQAKLGANHPDTIGFMANLGLSYRATGKLERAIPLLQQVLNYRKDKQGADHALTLSSLTSLAEAYVENKEGEKAVPLYDEFLARQRLRSKPNDPFFAGYLLQIAPPLMKVNQFAAAERHFREALGILETLAPTNWATAETKSQLGDALLSQKKYAEARPLLIAGYDGMCQASPKPKLAQEKLVAAVDRLIRLAEALELPDDAKKWHEEKDRLIRSLPKKESRK
jgi:hypothetical protein